MRHDIDGDGKFFDLHPFTTKQERNTLTQDALDALIAMRKAEVIALRVERRENGDLWWQMAYERWEKAMRWLGVRWYDDEFQDWLQSAVAHLANVPDPTGDGWTPYEIAAHLRGEGVAKLDAFAKWEKIPEILAAFGVAAVGDGVGAMLEMLDGPIIDALVGNQLEQYILALLVSPEDGVDLAAAGFKPANNVNWADLQIADILIAA